MPGLLILAGGTGGHVIPALAVAQALRARGVTVQWVGSHGSLEARLVPNAGIPFTAIAMRGMRNSGWRRWCALPVLLVLSFVQAYRLMRRYRPQAVLGMGGFVAGPVGLVAAWRRVPLLIHEQNAIAGLTNRWLARFSTQVFSGFPHVTGLPHCTWLGNPVRPEIANIPVPAIRLAHRRGPLRVLVIGGSQGARVFNTELPRRLATAPHPPLEVHHQCGHFALTDATSLADTITAAYTAAETPCRVAPFIEDMAAAYAWCDVLIARAGAMTVAEICCAGVVAILVPYPHAVNDHQAANAAYLVRQRAAFMLRQPEFVAGAWSPILVQCHADKKHLLDLATRARALAKPDATQVLARKCREYCDA